MHLICTPYSYIHCFLYHTVADAWSRRSGKDTAERAERILNRMILNYQSTKNKSIRPDVISFTSVIKAYVDHPDGGNKALEMLDEMNKQVQQGNVKAQPDAKTIAIAMDACAKSGLIDDASRLLDNVKDGDKNRVMFNTLISACKLQGRGDRAEELLRKMIDLSNKGFKKCSPDATTYSLCVFAVSIFRIDSSGSSTLGTKKISQSQLSCSGVLQWMSQVSND